MQDVLLTAHQAAQFLNVDKFTVYRIVTRETVPHLNLAATGVLSSRSLKRGLVTNSNSKVLPIILPLDHNSS